MRVLVRKACDLIAGHAGMRWAAGSSLTEAALTLALKRLPPASANIHSSSLLNRLPDAATLYAMKAMALIFICKAQSLKTQNKIHGAGVGHEIFHVERLRVAKLSLTALKFAVMVRSRGLPRRGGRTGTRPAFEGEEVNSFVPREAMTNSSSSSEQDFLMLPDSYLPIRLRIPGRLLRSDVIVNVSIYLSEAAPEENPSSSQAPVELQSSEILLGDMDGRVFHMLRPLSAIAPTSQHQPAQVQENLNSVSPEHEALPPTNTTQASEETHSAI